jgi:hypothetical protein
MKKKTRIRSGHIARMRRRWAAIGLPNRVAILGLVVAVLGLVPAYLALFNTGGSDRSSPAVSSGVTNTSLGQSSGQGALRLDAAYNRTRESIMWATAQALSPEDDLIIEAPNLAGNDPAQNKITALLLERGGVKIETDETEDYRPHSQVRLVVTGQHERPVLITGLRANVVRRERPLSEPESTDPRMRWLVPDVAQGAACGGSRCVTAGRGRWRVRVGCWWLSGWVVLPTP